MQHSRDDEISDQLLYLKRLIEGLKNKRRKGKRNKRS